jgi:hypothetical protein
MSIILPAGELIVPFLPSRYFYNYDVLRISSTVSSPATLFLGITFFLVTLITSFCFCYACLSMIHFHILYFAPRLLLSLLPVEEHGSHSDQFSYASLNTL